MKDRNTGCEQVLQISFTKDEIIGKGNEQA